MNSKEVLIIGDPWDTLDHERDTSLHLAQVANREFGLRVHWCLPAQIYLDETQFYAATLGEIVDGKLEAARASVRNLSGFASIHWRTDPPVDLSTYRFWSLLSCAQGLPPIVNPPSALLNWNEKFAALKFSDWMIPSLVTDSEAGFKSFFEKHHSKQLILKPSGQAASRGVTILPTVWSDAFNSFKNLRTEFGPWAVVQELDASIFEQGETRVFAIGGKIAGAISKKPSTGQAIMDLDAADALKPKMSVAQLSSEQTVRSTKIIESMARDQIHIATIDFIGPRILEINVTSPGLIQWLDERTDPKNAIAHAYWKTLSKSKN